MTDAQLDALLEKAETTDFRELVAVPKEHARALVLALREAREERDAHLRAVVNLTDRAEQAEAEVARPRAALDEWAAHKPFCGIMGQDNRFAWRDGDEESCTCGLAALKATGGQP